MKPSTLYLCVVRESCLCPCMSTFFVRVRLCPSVSLSACVPIRLCPYPVPVRLCLCPSVPLSVCVPVSLNCVLVSLPARLCTLTCPPVSLYLSLSIYVPIRVSLCPCPCLSTSLSLCVCVPVPVRLLLCPCPCLCPFSLNFALLISTDFSGNG